MSLRRPLACALITATGVAVGGGTASAQTKPVPCIGYTAQDPAGDQSIGLAGNFTGLPAEDSVDLTGLFFRSEAGKVTANIELTNASTSPPAGTAGAVHRFLYNSPPDLFLDIDITASGVTYQYGHFEDTGPVGDGETTGQIFEGEKGIISVDLPPSHGGKPGMRLSAGLFSSYSTGVILLSTDELPDGAAGSDTTFSYNGAGCPGSGAPAPGAPTPPPGGGTGPTQPSGPQGQPLGRLSMKASPSTLRAKKLKKGKAIAFRLSTNEKLTNVTAAFKKGSKTIGSGKLATLDRKGTIKVKPRSRPKKGRYQLVINAKRADGSNGSAVLKIRVR